jgi:hypothetical protein
MASLSPLDVLSGNRGAAPIFLRGKIMKVKTNKASLPTLLFDVAPEGDDPSGSADGIIQDVVLLQAGFGNLADASKVPGGIVHVPEVGSQALMIHDGRRWVIIGFYTGPVFAAKEQSADKEGLRVSYNPGVGLPVSRLNAQPGLDSTPDWAFGMQEGDSALTKGDSIIKVNGIGAFIGSGPFCWTIYKSDGNVLEKAITKETRYAGWHDRFYYHPGLPSYMVENSLPGAQATPNLGAFFYHGSVQDLTPYPELLFPFWVTQRGHVGVADLKQGHTAGTPLASTYSVMLENGIQQYSVVHDALFQPFIPVDKTIPGLEFPACMYDYQVKADGSFHIRSGNLARVPGYQIAGVPSTSMDFGIEYNALTGIFMLRVGPAGVPAALITVSGKTPADSTVTVNAANLVATLTGMANLNAPQGLTIVGNVKVVGNLDLTGGLTGAGPATMAGIFRAEDGVFSDVSFRNHTHAYVDGGGITQRPIGNI